MKTIQIAPIVEGQGDEASVRNLLQRIWIEMLGGTHANILKPVRRSQGSLLKADSGDLERAINLALLKLQQVGGGLVLLLVDAEDHCERLGSLGPLLLERSKAARSDCDVAVVIANVMFETWFVASAASLDEYLILPTELPSDPELDRLGKGWIKQRMRSGKYSEPIDQPSMTAKLDLNECRKKSRSFDKLCRELENRF